MSSHTVFKKVIGINFLILLIILFTPALLLYSKRKFYPRFVRLLNKTSDKRAYYPTYANKKFSIQLFNEHQKLTSNFRSYIGWRAKKVNFKFTNISGPYNTRKSTGEAIDQSTWFFGGSTIWGTGASDSQTIPSHFNSLTNNPVYNFGGPSWNSRQSLNQLINAIGDNHKPSTVIFYDGVNDVLNNCRREINLLPANVREKQIQNALKSKGIIGGISNFIITPYILFFEKFSIQNIVNQEYFKKYDCDINPSKALSIAKHLVNNWRTAYALSESEGFEFYAILQPTLFTTKTNSEYFDSTTVKKNSKYEIQYNIVYSLILQEIERYCESDKKFCSSIINGTDWLDGTDNIFIDYCHITSLGNKVIAQRMQSILKR